MPAAGPASPGAAELRPVFAIMQSLLSATDQCHLLDALLPALRAALAADGVAWTTVCDGIAVVHRTPGASPEVLLTAFDVHAGHDPLVVRTVHGGHPRSGRPGSGQPGTGQAGAVGAAVADGYPVYRPLGRHRQLAVEFAAGPHSRVYLAANRIASGFTPADRELLSALRPLLVTAMTRMPPSFPAGLTGREREVLDLLRLGLGDREIGHRLGISPRTVGKHLEHVYDKLGARGRLHALAYWRGDAPDLVAAR